MLENTKLCALDLNDYGNYPYITSCYCEPQGYRVRSSPIQHPSKHLPYLHCLPADHPSTLCENHRPDDGDHFQVGLDVQAQLKTNLSSFIMITKSPSQHKPLRVRNTNSRLSFSQWFLPSPNTNFFDEEYCYLAARLKPTTSSAHGRSGP